MKAIPALLAEEQWEALGRRLQGIESSLQVSQAPVPCIVQPCTLKARNLRKFAFLPTCPSQPPAHAARFKGDYRAAT